jgi:hypothetical protein
MTLGSTCALNDVFGGALHGYAHFASNEANKTLVLVYRVSQVEQRSSSEFVLKGDYPAISTKNNRCTQVILPPCYTCSLDEYQQKLSGRTVKITYQYEGDLSERSMVNFKNITIEPLDSFSISKNDIIQAAEKFYEFLTDKKTGTHATAANCVEGEPCRFYGLTGSNAALDGSDLEYARFFSNLYRLSGVERHKSQALDFFSKSIDLRIHYLKQVGKYIPINTAFFIDLFFYPDLMTSQAGVSSNEVHKIDPFIQSMFINGMGSQGYNPGEQPPSLIDNFIPNGNRGGNILGPGPHFSVVMAAAAGYAQQNGDTLSDTVLSQYNESILSLYERAPRPFGSGDEKFHFNRGVCYLVYSQMIGGALEKDKTRAQRLFDRINIDALDFESYGETAIAQHSEESIVCARAGLELAKWTGNTHYRDLAKKMLTFVLSQSFDFKEEMVGYLDGTGGFFQSQTSGVYDRPSEVKYNISYYSDILSLINEIGDDRYDLF